MGGSPGAAVVTAGGLIQTDSHTVGGTATAGKDYVALGTAVIFPAGVLSVTKTLTPLDDALQELPETVVLTLARGPGYAVGTPEQRHRDARQQ